MSAWEILALDAAVIGGLMLVLWLLSLRLPRWGRRSEPHPGRTPA